MFLDGYRESETHGIPGTIEIVAIALLCGPDLRSEVTSSESTQEAVAKIREHALTLMKLTATISFANSAEIESPLASVASELSSSSAFIRGNQYGSIGDEMNEAILTSEPISEIVNSKLGFTYSALNSVAKAAGKLYSKRKFDLLDRLRDSYESAKGEEPAPEIRKAATAALSDLFNTPGQSASLTSTDIAQNAGLDITVVRNVLNLYSKRFSEADNPAAAVTRFVHGSNPLSGRGLVRSRSDDRYLILVDAIPTDNVRRIIEAELKSDPRWQLYGQKRDSVAEELATARLSKILGSPPRMVAFEYYATGSTGDCDLSRNSKNPRSNTKLSESDALFVVDDVAICLEVKAGEVSDKARSGNIRRIARDLEKTVGDATNQASRVRRLIEENGGLWLRSGTWLELGHVREVRSIAACLDDFGSLGVAADALIRAGILDDDSIPWIVSLHDLGVVEQLGLSPAEFFLYLRRRTDPATSKKFVAVDELDVLMWFLRGGLYVEPDPDEIYRRYPMSPRPTKAMRARYRKEVPTRISTLTDSLDAWMYYREGLTQTAAEKPSRATNTAVSELVKDLAAKGAPGYLRVGADLLNLGSDAQAKLGAQFRQVIRGAARDGGFHTATIPVASVDGYVIFCAGSWPDRRDDYRAHFSNYLRAKKHQLKADRTIGIIYSPSGSILGSQYLDDEPKDDAGLDGLVQEMSLLTPAQMATQEYKERSERRRRKGQLKRNRSKRRR